MHGKLLTMGRTRRSLGNVIRALAQNREAAPEAEEKRAGVDRESSSGIDAKREIVLTQDEIEMLLNAKSMEAAQTA